MKEDEVNIGVEATLVDLLLQAEDSELDSFEGERGFYVLASLALGEILRKAPLRHAGVPDRSQGRPRKGASVH